MELIVGDKRWSSWSMRPWLALKHTGAAFSETVVRLRRLQTDADIAAAGSPSGLVPVLRDGEVTVWDSLAICEYLAEKFPQAALWPADTTTRALGRAAAAEMHSGFSSLRGECPMDIALRVNIDVAESTHKDVRRIVALWSDLLGRFGGPFLLGPWSIADAFFTPVATRFRSYGISLADLGDEGAAAAYGERLLATPEFLEWEREALADDGAAGSR